MRAMLREKRSISTAGAEAAAGGGAGEVAAAAAAVEAAAVPGGATGAGAASAGAFALSSMRFPPGRLLLRTLVLDLVILFGINLFEAILTDSDVVVHCSVNLNCL